MKTRADVVDVAAAAVADVVDVAAAAVADVVDVAAAAVADVRLDQRHIPRHQAHWKKINCTIRLIHPLVRPKLLINERFKVN